MITQNCRYVRVVKETDLKSVGLRPRRVDMTNVNEYIREKIGVIPTTNKARESHFRWFGHIKY
ncbi:hypothetical protein IEQ34_000507 [Dendrobium chrysotoxum]|uniref:Uncharacterized protein n=1 Tax=Dendrobium chrysotoxum TaxID=161865 RepID=A0AAV7HRF3_DENCH|nr:hypothetical protein IEQ34_000507 [Dendrobium chrysotoxum]